MQKDAPDDPDAFEGSRALGYFDPAHPACYEKISVLRKKTVGAFV